MKAGSEKTTTIKEKPLKSEPSVNTEVEKTVNVRMKSKIIYEGEFSLVGDVY